MGVRLNEHGLPVSEGSTLTIPPVVIVYGRSGAGKSFSMAQSFPDAYWITTHETVLRPYESWLRDNKAQALRDGLKMPERLNLPMTRADGKTKIDPRPDFDDLMQLITRLKSQGRFPYRGVVIDEFTEVSFRVNAQYKNAGWAGVDAVKEWHKMLANWARCNKILLGLVCHEAEPKWKKEDSSELQYPGGPALAIGTLRAEIQAISDVCVRLVTEQVADDKENPLKAMLAKTAKAPPTAVATAAATAPAAPAPSMTVGAVSLLGNLLGNTAPQAQPPAQVEAEKPAASAPVPEGPAKKSKIRRYWVTEARDEWVTKFRDFSIAGEEEISLREMLSKAGYI